MSTKPELFQRFFKFIQNEMNAATPMLLQQVGTLPTKKGVNFCRKTQKLSRKNLKIRLLKLRNVQVFQVIWKSCSQGKTVLKLFSCLSANPPACIVPEGALTFPQRQIHFLVEVRTALRPIQNLFIAFFNKIIL